MEPLLFLVHRIPFPPNKGDKIRSHYLLRHLAARYHVHLGTFVDRPEDVVHVGELAALCASHRVETIDARTARLRSLTGFLTGEALTLPYYRNAALRAWVRQTVLTQGIRKAVVFSTAMAQYVQDLPDMHVVLDFVDVDSAKWTQYAEQRDWPASFVYRREGEKLLSFERRASAASAASVFVTRAEAELFLQLAPECAGRVHAIEMGVDTQYLTPDAGLPSPYAADRADAPAALVFTGVMDYWPNVDAVVWFAREVLPRIVQRRPDVRFYIVGMNPAPAVLKLAADPHVVVTGRVPDVRPYLQHAAVVVAPLRIARGIQSKVLEAMAMARPVVVSSAAARSLNAEHEVELAQAADAPQFADAVLRLMRTEEGAAMGRRARARIVADYNWERNMAAFDRLLEGDRASARHGERDDVAVGIDEAVAQ